MFLTQNTVSGQGKWNQPLCVLLCLFPHLSFSLPHPLPASLVREVSQGSLPPARSLSRRRQAPWMSRLCALLPSASPSAASCLSIQPRGPGPASTTHSPGRTAVAVSVPLTTQAFRAAEDSVVSPSKTLSFQWRKL